MTALTITERDALAQHEETIREGLAGFAAAGAALLAIKKGRLYRDGFHTFEDYCSKRWGFKRAHAYRLIEASEIVAEMSPIGRQITVERQARVLKGLPPEQRNEIVEEAAAAGPITAERLADLRRRANVRRPTVEEVEAEEKHVKQVVGDQELLDAINDRCGAWASKVEKLVKQIEATGWRVQSVKHLRAFLRDIPDDLVRLVEGQA